MARGPSRLFDRLGPAIIGEVSRSLYAAGDLVRVEAQISITAGAVSGKQHVPSSPGKPPNNDTGTLAGGIVTVQTAPLTVTVTSTAPYSRDLEYGTSKTPARPFMAPAANAKRRDIQKLVSKAVGRAIRRAGRS